MSEYYTFPTTSDPEPVQWNGPDYSMPSVSKNGGGPYVCVDCQWEGGAVNAALHHRDTGHAVRGAKWPAQWGNALFSNAGPDGRRKP